MVKDSVGVYPLMIFSLCFTTYTVENYTPTILLYCRDEENKKHLIKVQYEPYFYINSWDWNRANIALGNAYYNLTDKLGNVKQVPLSNYITGYDLEYKVRGDPDTQLRKIVAKYPKHVGEMQKILAKNNITTYEADVLFYLRFLIDRGIKTGFEINGRIPTTYNAVPKEITPRDVESKHRIGYIDIETYGASEDDFNNYKAPVKIVCIYDSYTNTYYQFYHLDRLEDLSSYRFVHESKYIGMNYQSERDLLIAVRDFLAQMNFDLLVSFTEFDFDYILRRMKSNSIAMESMTLLGRIFEKTNQIVKQEMDSFKKRKVRLINIPDTESLDIQDVYKRFKLEPVFQNLDYVGKLELGFGKIPITSVYDNWNKHLYRETLIYNLRDVELIKELEHKMGLIMQFTDPIRRIVGCNFNHALIPTKVSDILYLRLVRARNIALRTKSPFRKGSKALEQLIISKGDALKYKGAHVYDPIEGVVKNVAVFDWSELYPSVIATYNIGWNTYRSFKSDIQVADLYNFTNEEESWTKLLLADLRKPRQEVKRQIKLTTDKEQRTLLKARSAGMKAMINAVYGAFGHKGEWDKGIPPSRLYSKNIAEAVTLGGQDIELEGGRYLTKELGYTLLQGDTDSLFIKLKSNEPKKEAEELRTQLEDHIKNYIKTNHHIEDVPLSVELDKVYEALIMFGIKKKYHGISEGSIEFKGIEALRRDTAEITGELQLEIGKMILENVDKPPSNKISEMIKKTLISILSGSIPMGKVMVKGKCGKAKYKTKNRNLSAIQNAQIFLGQTIYTGERFYWIYLTPFKHSGTLVTEVGSLIPSLPKEFMHKVDWNRMATYAVVNPLKKYCKVIGIDIQKLYLEAKYEVQKQSYLTSFM